MDDGLAVLMGCLLVGIGAVSGWVFAHATVATECERLRAFYVGDSTYICRKAN